MRPCAAVAGGGDSAANGRGGVQGDILPVLLELAVLSPTGSSP